VQGLEKKKKSMKTRYTKVLKQLGGEGNYSSKQMLASCFLICWMSPSQFTYNKSNHRINRNNKDPLICDATSQLCAESMINEDRKQMVMDRQDGMDPVSFYLSVPCIIRGNQFTVVDTEIVSVEPFWHGSGGF
jgi:hypothetical protein